MKEKNSSYVPADSVQTLSGFTFHEDMEDPFQSFGEITGINDPGPVMGVKSHNVDRDGEFMPARWSSTMGYVPTSISYDTNRRPLNNRCVAVVTPYTRFLPVIRYRETRTSFVWNEAGKIRDVFISEHGPDIVIHGWPSRVSYPKGIVGPFTGRGDPVTKYVQLLSGRGTSTTGEAELGGVALQLLELKDLPELLRTLRSFFKFLRNLRKPAGWRVSFKDLAGSFLAVQYGVLPTIDQIEFFYSRLWKAVKEFSTRVSVLVNRGSRSKDSYARVRSALLYRDRARGGFRGLARNRDKDWIGFPSDYGLRGQVIEYEPDRSQHEPFIIDRRYDASSYGWQDASHDVQLARAMTERLQCYFATYVSDDLMWSMFRLSDIAKMSGIEIISQMLIDLLQPFSNIWAVFPLSFVYDWFASFDGVAERFDSLLAYFTTRLDPVDGVWRGTKYEFLLGTTLELFSGLRVSEAHIIDLRRDAENNVTSFTVRQVYKPPAQGNGRIRLWPCGGKVYRRRPVQYGGMDIVLPSWNIDLNFSKSISLTAIVAGRKR